MYGSHCVHKFSMHEMHAILVSFSSVSRLRNPVKGITSREYLRYRMHVKRTGLM